MPTLVFKIAATMALAITLSGCSNQTAVIGNIASMIVTIALFYSTINLKRR